MRITEGQLRRIIREEIELQEMGGQRLMQTQVEYIYQLADGS